MRIPVLLERLDDLAYPVTTEQAVAELDDPAVHLPDGRDRLSFVLDRIGVDRLESSDDARLVVLSGFDDDAIGRRQYSDRDPPVPCEERGDLVAF